MKLVVYSDGASRGNPGRAGIGIVVTDEKGDILKEHSEYVGIKTNNQAEYLAMIKALEIARELGAEEIELISDSQLLIRQLTGKYSTKNPTLKKLQRILKEKASKFKKVSYSHVKRDNPFIRIADRLANLALNQKPPAGFWTSSDQKY